MDAFKRLVRDTLGSTSRQYRRIHQRGASSAEEESTTAEAEAETQTQAEPATEPAPPASEAAPSVA